MVDSNGAGDDGGKWWILKLLFKHGEMLLEMLVMVEKVFKWWKCQAFSFVDVEEETRR